MTEEFYGISENYKVITEKLNRSLQKANRIDTVKLMAVTKTVPVSKVNFAVSLGIKLLGENRAQEFVEKYPHYDKNCEIHFIGVLQNNKVKYIIDKVAMIESVDSFKLASEISRRAVSSGSVMDILLEVNIAREESKAGFYSENLFEMVSAVSELPAIRIRGLMTIPPLNKNGGNESNFEKMQIIFHDCIKYVRYSEAFDTLSMGMSYDYETAVRYGSNIIRIGRALFGERMSGERIL